MNNSPKTRRATSSLLLIGAVIALLGLSLLAAEAHRKAAIASRKVLLRFENATPKPTVADTARLQLVPDEGGLVPVTLKEGKSDSLALGTYNLYVNHGTQQAALNIDLYSLLAPYPDAQQLVVRADGHIEGTLLVQFLAIDAAGNTTQVRYEQLSTYQIYADSEENFGDGDSFGDFATDELGYSGAVSNQAPTYERRDRAEAKKSKDSPSPGGGRYYHEPTDKPDYNSGGEQSLKQTPNSFQAVVQHPLSTFSIDVDRAAYSFLRRHLLSGQLPTQDEVRIEEMINYFPYTYPAPTETSEHPFLVHTEVATCPWAPTHQLLRVGIQGQQIETKNLPPNNLVFLLDVSGSMMEADKLPLVKASLQMLVRQLRPQDQIAIVVYAGAAGLVLPSTPASQEAKITAALEQLEAGGSTAGGEGILLAYKVAKENFLSGGNNRVILCTDGDFNVGVASESGLQTLIEQERKSGVFLTVMGFGTGNTKDNYMELLADKGNGNYAYIDNLLEAQKMLVQEMGSTLFAIAKDVKLQLEFNPAAVKGYRLIGYENRLLRDEDFANDTIDAGELGAGHTVTALYEIIPAGSTEAVPGASNLKYTQPATGSNSGELLTVNLRYKRPKEDTSRLLAHVVNNSNQSIDKASEDFRFCASVAAFGLALRQDPYKGAANYQLVQNLAQNSIGKDALGYRNEFLRLVLIATSLDRRQPQP